MGLFSSLSREQKESIGLLQIGTFLEYFDLYLYVHMAVLLNELFFPQADSRTASILAAAAFCSTFVFRPIGAVIFGWIGDHIGRKSTIIMTTTMMAVSCVAMANLPTYAQIGIAAAWIVTICRIFQGISSMGEVIGAQIYLTETVKIPARYPATAFLAVSNDLGGFFAIAVAFFVTSSGFNWRFAFWFGAVVAIVGAIARTRLRETPEFLEMKRKQLKKEIEETNLEFDPIRGAELNKTWKEPVNSKTLLSYFFIGCGSPLCFYLAFIYFNPVLKDSFGYSSEDIIRHNFFLSLISTTCSIIITYLCYRIHPLKVNKMRGVLGLLLMVSLPFLIRNLTSSAHLFAIQALIVIVALEVMPSVAVFLRHFPIYRRVSYASILFSISKASMYIITSFGLIYLGNYLGHFGLWIITLPTALAYLYGIFHYESLEHQLDRVHQKIRKDKPI